MATRIKLRRDTATRWQNINPVLSLGEPGVETDTGKMKIGDGISTWNTLDYFAGEGSGATDRLTAGGDEVILVGGADPYVTFPAVTGGDQLQIQGAEIGSISGSLALTSRDNLIIIANGSGDEPGGSKSWTFGANGAIDLADNGVIRNQTDGKAVNIVANEFVQLQWTTDQGVSESDPNDTEELTNWLYVDGGGVNIQTNVNGSPAQHWWLFDPQGNFTKPAGAGLGGYRISIDENSNTVFESPAGLILTKTGASFPFEQKSLVSIEDANVVITTDADDDAKQWTFDNASTLTLPQGGTIAEGVVTSNPTIQLTPASPTVASQKLVIKGGGNYNAEANGIALNWYTITPSVGETVQIYVYSIANANLPLYWWIHPTGADIATPDSGMLVLESNGTGNFSFVLDSDDYEFTLRVSTIGDVYDPETIGVETQLFNEAAPSFGEHHLHLTTGNLNETSIFLGTDDHHVRTTTNDGVQVTTPRASMPNNVWTFDDVGDLNLPDNGGIVFDRANTSIRVGMGFHIASGEGISLDAIDQTAVLTLSGAGNGPVNQTYNKTTNTLYTGNDNSSVTVENLGGTWYVLIDGDSKYTSNDLLGWALSTGPGPVPVGVLSNGYKSWYFSPDGDLTFPDATVQTTAYPGVNTVANLVSTTSASITTALNPNNGPFGGMVSGNLEGNGIVVFGPDGGTGEPDELDGVDLARLVGGTITLSSAEPLSSPILGVTSLGNKLYSIQVEGTLATVTGGEGIGLTITVDPLSTQIWTFGTNGTLTFPGGATVRDLPGATSDDSVLILGAGTTIAENQRAARIGINGSVEGVSIGAGSNDWTFTNDGTLTLPFDNKITVGGDMDSNSINFVLQDSLNPATTFEFAFDASMGMPLLRFPDDSLQSTAWTGGRVVAVPAHSYGATGDKEGDLAFSNGYIYYCTQDHVSNSTNVTTLASSGTFVYVSSTDYAGDLVADFTSNSTGWTYNGVTIVSVAVDNGFGPGYILEAATSFSVVNGNDYALVSPLTTNIWKRVAWSGDTW